MKLLKINIHEKTLIIGSFLSDQFYYRMLCSNFKEVLKSIEEYEQANKSFTYSHEFLPYAEELNRSMINALGSVFTYLYHFEFAYKKIGKEKELLNFKTLSSKYFDQYFIYRFFYKLRNYVVHCKIPITCLEDSAKSPTKTFFFDREALLDGFDWGISVRQDLQNGKETYCVKELVLQALSMYREFHIEMINNQLKNVILSMKELEGFSRAKDNFRQFPVFLILDEDEPEHPSIQSMIADNYIPADKELKDLAVDLTSFHRP